MKLATDWKSIIRRAWSIRLMILAGLLSGLEVALPLFDAWSPFDPGVFAAASGLVTAGAFVARLVSQQNLEA